ncbi:MULTISPECIES: outer membrane protein assembly factor BamB [unclassified Moraxella]|uniref:outer membrane protein assembly factor BamB n=1 Tax=unclassified Moraxella TaxID=2685852 RepID=UPI002B402689|nr:MULTISPECIES: outer membrane protein assembly factor BamB [unclassified Moraxella]
MNTRFTKIVLGCTIGAAALMGCQQIIKGEDKSPAKLIKIATPMTVLSPIFEASLEQSRGLTKGERVSKKDVIDLQVAQSGGVLIAVSRSGVVSAFDDKQSIWKLDLQEPVTSGVAIDEAGLVAVVGTRSGKVIALNVGTGEKLWETALPTSTPTPALIHHDRVLLSANNGVLYGLNIRTGENVWQFGTQKTDLSIRGVAKPLSLDEQTVLFGTADGRIHALDSSTGSPLWTRRVGMATGGSVVERLSDVDGTPLVVGQHLYVTSFSGQIVGFDMATGQTMFVSDISSTRSATVLGDVLVAVGISGDVKAFNRLTGETLWLNDELKNRKLTNPVAIGDYVAVGDYEGVIHLFDRNGSIVSRVQTKGQLTSLQVIDNRLYTQSTSGVVSIWQF